MDYKDLKIIKETIHSELEMMEIATDTLLTNQECMKHLGLQRTAFSKIVEQIPCVYVGERTPKNRRFFKSKVNLWLEKQARI